MVNTIRDQSNIATQAKGKRPSLDDDPTSSNELSEISRQEVPDPKKWCVRNVYTTLLMIARRSMLSNEARTSCPKSSP